MVDALTGLLTRTSFLHQSQKLIQYGQGGLAVIWFNLDNFKMFNNRFGFERGDEILKEIAMILGSVFSKGSLARFADDSFVVLTDWATVEINIDMVQEYLYSLHENVTLRLRAGIYFPSSYEDIRTACDRAKLACDSIRKNHNVSTCIFQEEMSKELALQQHILDHLDSAVKNNYIKILYQPIINISTGKICETEALARWFDPELGLIPPGEFVPTLEQYREIQKLDIYAVKSVCREISERRDKGLPFLATSINLSRLDFELCDITREIDNYVMMNNLPRNILNIEITESVNDEDPRVLRIGIEKFRALGYKVWMDDFGSGYSSLNVLKDYNFDTVKFDMKFLRGFDINKSDKAKYIISSNLSMARLMGMQALAEGVETHEQFEYLRSIGFDKAQGYLFGKPMELEDIFKLEICS